MTNKSNWDGVTVEAEEPQSSFEGKVQKINLHICKLYRSSSALCLQMGLQFTCAPWFNGSLFQLLWGCLAFLKFWVETVALLTIFKLASLKVASGVTTELLSQKMSV